MTFRVARQDKKKLSSANQLPNYLKGTLLKYDEVWLFATFYGELDCVLHKFPMHRVTSMLGGSNATLVEKMFSNWHSGIRVHMYLAA
jgi:hypothetical protein